MCCFCSYSLLFLLLSLYTFIPPGSATPHTPKPPNSPAAATTDTAIETTMVQSELQTLFRIMEAMSSDTNWRLTYPNPCKPGSSWRGLECKPMADTHLHVTRLDFGTPPNPTCKPTATFPSQIFDLPYLQSVFFYNCFSHFKTTIHIPVFSKSPLQQLSLRSNPSLFGKIPSQISHLKSLQVLTLSQNRLTGSVPVELSKLNLLVHLDLSYNMLSGTIPFQLGNLKNLVGLDLSYNSLSDFIPRSIGQLGLLQKLDLSSNSLIGTIPNTIGTLSSLNFIALSNNRLRGIGFPKTLCKLVNLQYFIMDNNPMLIPIPSEFGSLIKLQELRLANSGYSGNIPLSFCNLINLTTLSLEKNRLTGEIPAGFTSLTHIYHLNLSRNFLEGVVPFNESFFRRLGRNLDLSGNSGLCLDPKEAFGVKNDVNFCGSQKINSFLQPRKKSEAATGFDLVSVFGMLAVLLLHWTLFFV